MSSDQSASDRTVHDLSPAMHQILQDSLPAFLPWTMEHYDQEVQSWLRHIRITAPWQVFGDFNADGIEDVVIDGTDGRRDLRVALVSKGPTYRFLVLQANPRWKDVPSIEFIAYEALTPAETPATTESPHDGFTVVVFEKASAVYRWTGDGFAYEVDSD